MASIQDLNAILLKMVERTPDCDVEDLVAHCPQATWNQVFLALDNLSREGQLTLRQQGPGHYKVGAVPRRLAGGRISPQHHN